MAATSQAGVLGFGPFELDGANARLSRDGAPVALTPKAFELLAFLVQRPGRLVTKDELLDAVWGRRFITEGVVKTVVSELRAALDDDAREPRYIETVPRRGYRFVAALRGVGAPPPPPSPGPPGPRLFGRDGLLAELLALLQTRALLTLAGPGGVGKTRLALAALQRLPVPADGTAVLELAGVPADAEAPALRGLVAQALGLPAAAAADAATLAREAAPLRAVLLVDNAEHLAAAVADLVAALPRRPGGLRWLVTSQEPLGLADETVLRVPPLPLPAAGDDADVDAALAEPAVQLLVDRASQRLPGFVLTAHQAAAARAICRRLDGLPLAIELAAARVPLLGLHGLLERLDDEPELEPGHPGGARGLALLAQASRSAPTRHRSLHDTLAWSHALLDADEQVVFRRLAVFRGGFRLEMAERVCADARLDATAVLDAISGLVDKSFVTVDVLPDGRHRLRLLEGPRQFAEARLALAEPAAPVLQRHAEAVHDWITDAAADLPSSPVLDWLARHAADVDNLRAALRWAGGTPQTWPLAAGLLVGGVRLWMRLGRVDEAQQALDRLRPGLAALGDDAEAAHARGCFVLAQAQLAIYGDEPAAAALQALVAAEPWLARQDPMLRYDALHLRYVLMLIADPQADRQPVLAAAQALEQPSWHRLVTLSGRMDRAHEAGLRGDAKALLAFTRAEWAAHRREGCQHESWTLASMLMTAEAIDGRLDEALAIGRAAVAEVRASGRLRTLTTTYTAWLQLLGEAGATAELRAELADTAPALLLGPGRLWMVSLALPWLALHEGRQADGARLLGWRDAAIARIGPGVVGAYTRHARALLQERLGAALGAEGMEALRAEGETLDDTAALELALR